MEEKMGKKDCVSVVTLYGKNEIVENMIYTTFSNEKDAKNYCMVNNELHHNTDEWVCSRIVKKNKNYFVGSPKKVNFNVIYQLDQDDMIELIRECKSAFEIEYWPKLLINADDKTINRIYKAIEMWGFLDDRTFVSLDDFTQKILAEKIIADSVDDHSEISSLEDEVCIELVHLSIEGKISVLNLIFNDE
jgi:hypothetical protein